MEPTAASPVCPRTHYRTSGDVQWDRETQEVFNHQAVAFDVRQAKDHLATHRVPVQYVPIAELSEHLQCDRPAQCPRAARLEPGRLASADPDVPIVVAPMPGRGIAVIDGNHRLEVARASGCAEVPVVVLPEKVAAKISKDWTPPIVWRNVYRQ